MILYSIGRTLVEFLRNDYRGAVGIFQLMPSTARRMGLNPYSLDDNIKGGIMYYKSMYKMFGSMELALAAYNAGPGNVKKYGGKVENGEIGLPMANSKLVLPCGIYRKMGELTL